MTASGLQNLPNRIGQQPGAKLPAGVADAAVVIVDRHLRHRGCLCAKCARGHFGLDVFERSAARRTLRRWGAVVILIQ